MIKSIFFERILREATDAQMTDLIKFYDYLEAHNIRIRQLGSNATNDEGEVTSISPVQYLDDLDEADKKGIHPITYIFVPKDSHDSIKFNMTLGNTNTSMAQSILNAYDIEDSTMLQFILHDESGRIIWHNGSDKPIPLAQDKPGELQGFDKVEAYVEKAIRWGITKIYITFFKLGRALKSKESKMIGDALANASYHTGGSYLEIRLIEDDNSHTKFTINSSNSVLGRFEINYIENNHCFEITKDGRRIDNVVDSSYKNLAIIDNSTVDNYTDLADHIIDFARAYYALVLDKKRSNQ